MRICIAIPHFYRDVGGKHHSLRGDPKPRIRALSRQILNLHRLFGGRNGQIRVGYRTSHFVNQNMAHELTILVCTTGDDHLAKQLTVPRQFFEHVATDAEPHNLGLACRMQLRDRLGEHDYYCYLEDDLILHDPLFFQKIAWFTAHTGNVAVLGPNRYELPLRGPFTKLYIDGDLKPEVTQKYQDREEQPQLRARVMDWEVAFERPLNPHSGCYFLNAAQMTHWTEQDHFSLPSDEFIGPLESAATLGILRTFRIYKPHPACSGFLEIEHAGNSFASLIGKSVAPPEKSE